MTTAAAINAKKRAGMVREEQAEDCQDNHGNAAEVEDRSRKLGKGLDINRPCAEPEPWSN
jgi:hypothetical protein